MFKTILAAIAATTLPAFAQVGNPAVTTGQYNSGRTSANTAETILTTSNVNVAQFGKLFSWAVDGAIFAQPLYVPLLTINGTPTNVVFVATMHNSVYAFNADQPGAPPLWHVNLGSSVTTPNANGCPSSSFTGPELGVLSTPVIDQSSNTLYAVAATPSGGGFVHYLHALNIITGQENVGSPVLIQASVPGTGYDNQAGTVTLSPSSSDIQRTALLLANGSVYAGFGNCGPDNDPWHGWVVGYSTSKLQNQTLLFNTTPNGGQGGIWQSGRGLMADTSGDLYFTTGNASQYQQSDVNVTTRTSSGDAARNDYPMRLVQLTPTGQFVGSYPPANYASMNDNDLDFSSSGPLLIPGQNLVVAGGKDGILYLFNPSNLGVPVQSFQATGAGPCTFSSNGCDQIHDLAFWNSNIYIWGTNDVLRSYSFSNGLLSTVPSSQNALKLSDNPASLAVSGNQAGGGIVWAMTPNSTLHAYQASNVGTELWNSNQNSNRDALPSAPHFTEPTVVNGRVYMATRSGQLAAYGLLSDFTLSTSAPSLTAYFGAPTSLTVDTEALAGLSTAVTLSVSGLPAGATATFSPSIVTGSGSSVLTVTTTSITPTGTYNLLVTGTAGGVTRTGSVALVVTTPDVTPPQWTCCTYTTGGSSAESAAMLTMMFSAADTQSGLKSIQVVQEVNASISIPAFTPGTTNTVNFSATESGWSSYVKFKLTDMAGNISYIDPAYLETERQKGAPASHGLRNISREEGIVTILNGTPGIKNMTINVNSGLVPAHIQVAGLRDGEVRVVDIRASLPTSGSTTVDITPLGKPGGSAMVVFAGSEMLPAGAPPVN